MKKLFAILICSLIMVRFMFVYSPAVITANANPALLLPVAEQIALARVVYNVNDWKYGFTTAICVDDNKERLSRYLLKYISKGNDKIFGKYFWSSKDRKSVV